MVIGAGSSVLWGSRIEFGVDPLWKTERDENTMVVGICLCLLKYGVVKLLFTYWQRVVVIAFAQQVPIQLLHICRKTHHDFMVHSINTSSSCN